MLVGLASAADAVSQQSLSTAEAVSRAAEALARAQADLAAVRDEARTVGLRVSGTWVHLPRSEPEGWAAAAAIDLDDSRLRHAFLGLEARTVEALRRWADALAALDDAVEEQLRLLVRHPSSLWSAQLGEASSRARALRTQQAHLLAEARVHSAHARELSRLAYLDEVEVPELYRRLDVHGEHVRAAEPHPGALPDGPRLPRGVELGLKGFDPLLTAYATYDDVANNCESVPQAVISNVGGLAAGTGAGWWAGGAAGAAAGSVVPGLGTAVGFFTGVAVGSLVSWGIDTGWEAYDGPPQCRTPAHAAGSRREAAAS